MPRGQFLLFVSCVLAGLVVKVGAADCDLNTYACGTSACCAGSDICCSNAAGACCQANTPYCCDDGRCAATPSACVYSSDAGLACAGYAIPCGGACIPAGSDCCNALGDHCSPTEVCTTDNKCAIDGTTYPWLRKLEGTQIDAETSLSPTADPPNAPNRSCAMTVSARDRPVPLPFVASAVTCFSFWRRKRRRITKHLEVLADAGLVYGTRQGRKRIWEIEKARLARAQLCLQQISQQWDGALQRLKAFVER